jgi:hypothetical protein
MNEVIQTHSRRTLRYKLLLSASSAAILVAGQDAAAQDTEHPTLWIELGGAFDQMSDGAEGWVPPNLTAPISNPSPEPFGAVPGIASEFEGAITLQPNGSRWSYTASARYGRAQRGPKRTHDQGYGENTKYHLTTYAFLNATDRTHSSHAIIDFSAGKDVGLGAWHNGKATIHFGVRVAQLSERAQGTMTALSTSPKKYGNGKVVHKADALLVRSFSGLGPSAAWDSSTPLVGELSDGIAVDWGVNASVLFGRQKASLSLHTNDSRYYTNGKASKVLSQSTVAPLRNRTVVVPDVGGFAGFSWRLPNGKVSLGYRADFFFGAIDGGVATSQKEMRGFYGPFASVSLGFGG